MLHGRPQICEDVKVCRYFEECWTCSLHVPFFHASSQRFHWPPSTHTQLCKKPRKVCHHRTFGAPCLAIVQLMDRLNKRGSVASETSCQHLLATWHLSFSLRFLPMGSEMFILVTFIIYYSHTASYRGMPCHGACHSFDDSRKPKTCRLREVPGTWPHPHCSCTPGQCPRILSPFTILHKTDKTKWIWRNWRHWSQRFGTKSCSSCCVTHELQRLPDVCCSTRGCSHRFSIHTFMQFSGERHSRLATLVSKRLYRQRIVSEWFGKTNISQLDTPSRSKSFGFKKHSRATSSLLITLSRTRSNGAQVLRFQSELCQVYAMHFLTTSFGCSDRMSDLWILP